MIGKRYGQLAPFYYAGLGKFRCRCNCGQEVEVDGEDLKSGKVDMCATCRYNYDVLEGKIVEAEISEPEPGISKYHLIVPFLILATALATLIWLLW